MYLVFSAEFLDKNSPGVGTPNVCNVFVDDGYRNALFEC